MDPSMILKDAFENFEFIFAVEHKISDSTVSNKNQFMEAWYALIYGELGVHNPSQPPTRWFKANQVGWASNQVGWAPCLNPDPCAAQAIPGSIACDHILDGLESCYPLFEGRNKKREAEGCQWQETRISREVTGDFELENHSSPPFFHCLKTLEFVLGV